MAYLTLNGVTVPVAVDSVSMSFEDVGGERERSPLGELVGGPIATKREWKMSTTPLPVSEIDAWVGLIEGAGHMFPFDADLYSVRGRGPSGGTGALNVVTKKYGAASLEVLSSDAVSWALGFGSSWTVVFWGNVGLGWVHYIYQTGGNDWVDGDPAPGANVGEVAVSGGALTLAGADGNDWLFDDVVALPYAVPASWPAGMFARHSASAWSALPRVLAAGDFSASSVTVRGKVTGSKVIRHSRNGSLTSGHLLDFTLREV